MTATTRNTARHTLRQAALLVVLGTALIAAAAPSYAAPDAPAQTSAAPAQGQNGAAPVHTFIGEGWG